MTMNNEQQFDFYWKEIFDGLAYNPIEFNVYRFDQSMSLPSKFNKLYEMLKVLALNNQEVMDYLKEFVETFDFKLETTIKDILIVWLNEGLLADVVREAINEEVVEARTDYLGQTYLTLKERLDLEREEVISARGESQSLEERLNNDKAEIVRQLTQTTQQIIGVNIRKFGDVSNGLDSASDAIEQALLSIDDPSEYLELGSGTFRITRPLRLNSRYHSIRVTNCTILADFANWETDEYVAVKFYTDVSVGVEKIMQGVNKLVEGIEIKGIGNTNKISTALWIGSELEIVSTSAVNHSLFGGCFRDIKIRNFDTAIKLKECWTTNFLNIHLRDIRVGLDIEGKSVNLTFDGIQATEYSHNYTSSADKSFGVKINSGFHYMDGEGRPEGLVFDKCLIFGADINLDLKRALFVRFDKCIIDGAKEKAVSIGELDNVTISDSYLFSSGGSVVEIKAVSASESKVSLINNQIVGRDKNDVLHGVNFIIGGVSRNGLTIENNFFANVDRPINCGMTPDFSSIRNNTARRHNKSMIFIQNGGDYTVIDGNSSSEVSPVVSCLSNSTNVSKQLDIRANKSGYGSTLFKGKATILSGQSHVQLPNGIWTSEIGIRVLTTATPKGNIGSWWIEENTDWSRATLKTSSPVSADTVIYYIATAVPSSLTL